MSPGRKLRTVQKQLREHGLKQTAVEIAGYTRRTVGAQLDGIPGNHWVRFRLLTRRYDSVAITPLWVSPDQISALSGGYERRNRGHLDYVPQFKPREAGWDSLSYEEELPYGTVKGGDWDRKRAPFNRLCMYRGTRERFIEGVAWDDTIYHEELTAMFTRNGWDYEDALARATKRCEKLESLAAELTEHGYQSQRERNGHPLHEVTVNLSRDGELLYNCEGRHRLCLAKVLGIEKIPVLVLARHADTPSLTYHTER